MGLFSKFVSPEPQEGKYGEKSAVPETISGKKWDRLHDSLPFSKGPTNASDVLNDPDVAADFKRGVKFDHQRFWRPGLS
jgi:hypothetical protein